MRRFTLALVPALSLVGCKTASDGQSGVKEFADAAPVEIPSSPGVGGAFGVDSVFIPIAGLEQSTNKTAKVAIIKNADGTETRINRCHQTYIQATKTLEITICRDAAFELAMDVEYGHDNERWARLKTAAGAEVKMLCKKVSETQPFGDESFVTNNLQQCKPTDTLTANGQQFMAAIDAAPTAAAVRHPTGDFYFPTNRDGAWKQKLAAALPIGEYVGFSTTLAKECKVVVSASDVTIFSKDGKKLGSVELGEATVFAWLLMPAVKQDLNGKDRDAAVLFVSAESETTTKQYYFRNLKVIRVAEQPANVDAGHTAVFVGANYCQRLRPVGALEGSKLPAPNWN